MDIQAAFDQFERDGYCLLEAILDQGQAEALDQAAQSLMAHQQGYAKLEGALSVLPDLVDLCIHADVLSIADRFLGTSFYLCNNACMMWCQPGAPGGQIHADWPLGDVPQPYPSWPTLLQTMWMLTDFTEDNGGPGCSRKSQVVTSTQGRRCSTRSSRGWTGWIGVNMAWRNMASKWC